MRFVGPRAGRIGAGRRVRDVSNIGGYQSVPHWDWTQGDRREPFHLPLRTVAGGTVWATALGSKAVSQAEVTYNAARTIEERHNGTAAAKLVSGRWGPPHREVAD